MESSNVEVFGINNGEEAVEKNKKFLRIPRISLFHISVGVVLLFCVISITTFSINARPYQEAREVFILTFRNDTITIAPTATGVTAITTSTSAGGGATTAAVTATNTAAVTATNTAATSATTTAATSAINTATSATTDAVSGTASGASFTSATTDAVSGTTSGASFTSAISASVIFTNPTTIITPSTTESASATSPSTAKPSDFCSEVPDLEKFDCTPDAPLNETECQNRGCCYKLSDDIITSDISSLILGVPSCYYPSNYQGYNLTEVNMTDYGYSATMKRLIPSGFPTDIQTVYLVIEAVNEKIVEIRLTNYDKKRYEVPKPRFMWKHVPKEHCLLDVELSDDGLLTVSRKLSGISIFETKLSQLIYSDQFLQISSKLPSGYIYGLGEHYGPFLKSTNWTRLTFFNKDNFPKPDLNLYGTHPFYLNIEEQGSSNGVLLLNSNAMDVIIQPTPALTYRTIGGVLDFYVILGDDPADVVKEYTGLVGRSHIPPYWSLGFHLCRYGIYTANNTRKIWKRNVDAGIPFDVQWNDNDYMDNKNDFTYSHPNFTELPDFINELHEKGMRYVVMFDPGVSNTEEEGTYPPYDDGVRDDIFLKDSENNIFIGKVWNPNSTVFPDFSHPEATKYWTNQFQLFHDQIDFDGAWIDMNEVSNFHCNGSLLNGCPESKYEDPPYVPGGIEPLRTKTICMTAKHYKTIHYNEHNIYGYREAIATNKAMASVTKKRPFVISRSTFPGQGNYTGHWSGDIASTWQDMRYSIINMLAFNIYGIPMVGSDICGFRENTTVELCARWNALGAFYPFARNHNDIDLIDQDPASMEGRVLNIAKEALFLRYEMLPYLYTLFFNSHIHGETVVRPLFFEFPNDPETYYIEEQFMWGSGLMIAPVLYPDVVEISAYFPKALWYELYTGTFEIMMEGEYITLPAVNDTINIFLQGGNIIPFQRTSTTTTASRMNNFHLLAGLNENKKALGELYWDDGESLDPYENGKYNHIKFYVEDDNSFSSRIVRSRYNVTMNLEYVKICGTISPSTVTLNNKEVQFVMKYECLQVFTNDQSLLEPFRINWD